ncbi:C25 family cysteine peptidase, partial [candidate division KSB1 bacterium]
IEGSTLPQRSVVDNFTNNVVVEYVFNGAYISQQIIENTRYDLLNIEGFTKMTDVGKPAMPMHNDLIAVPSNAIASISVVDADYIEYDDYYIHPALEPALDEEGAPEPTFIIDKVTYSTNAYYPENIVEITETPQIRGINIVNTQICPVQFNPVTHKIRVYSRIKFRVEFSGLAQSFNDIALMNSFHFTSMLKNVVLNAQSIPQGVNTLNNLSGAKDYIIITSSDYLAAADSLLKWKQQLGYDVHLISKPFWTSQEIRDTIYNCYMSWIPRPDYFVIIGDHDDVPATLRYTGANPPEEYPTDLYYACMDGSVDYFPDMARGRISISSAAEAMTVVQKIINYEKNPVTDPSFYTKGLNCAQYQDDNNDSYADRRFTHTSEEIRDYLMGQGYQINRIYYTDYNVNPVFYNNGHYSTGDSIPIELLKPGFSWNGSSSVITATIDSGRFYVLHRDHGYVGGSGWAHPYYVKNNINNLNNGVKLPVVFSINCHTGEFSLTECFAEKFLRKANGGAVGVLAASFASYSGYNDGLTVGFFDAIWSNPGLVPEFGSGGANNPSVSSHTDIYRMGDVMDHGLIRMVQTWRSSRYQFELYHYFGDPAMEIRTTTPMSITAVHADTLPAGSTYISISNSTCPDALATLCYDGDLVGKTQLINGTGVIVCQPLLDTNKIAILTLSKHNYIPYIADIVIINGGEPLNNDPCDALPLPVNKYCDPVIGNTAGATTSSGTTICGNVNMNDVWFSAIVPQSGQMIIEGFEVNGGFSDGTMEVYKGNCINRIYLACDDTSGINDMPMIELYQLVPGDTILVRFWNDTSETPGFFGICAYEPAPAEYAILPYFTGFENGLDMHWDTTSSVGNGRIRIDSIYQPWRGNFHLLMDVDTAGTYSINAASLYLDLYGTSNVQLSFWWKEFNDESNSYDGVYFSDDGGQNFVKVFDLTGDYQEYAQFILDVDQLAAIHGLNFSSSFVIKFQQYDNWYMTSDGFAIDNVQVIDLDVSLDYATLPYSTGFESGLDTHWSATSELYNGRIRISPYNAPFADSLLLAMDVKFSDYNYNRNETRLHLDLDSENVVLFTAWFKEFGDESHEEDGIFFSDDGGKHFTKALGLSGNISNWTKLYLDVKRITDSLGLSLTNEFVVKFQQYDNGAIGADGFAFDNIEITRDSLLAKILVVPDTLFFSTDTATIQIDTAIVYNIGSDTLEVQLGSIPNSRYTIVPMDFNVLPGDSQLVVITFTPNEVRDYRGNTIFFANAFPNTDTLYLDGKGTSPPYGYIISNFDTIYFDTIALNNTQTKLLEVSNTGTGTTNIIDIQVPVGFSIYGDTSFSMLPGGSKIVFVRFTPQLPI